MVTRRCCCFDCNLLFDDFDRADGDPGTHWYHGRILDHYMQVDSIEDPSHIKVCHPPQFSLGSVWVKLKLVNIGGGSEYRIKLGDPNGDLEIIVIFTGEMDTGSFTLRVTNGSDFEEWEYPWENDPEEITACFQPGVQLSARTTPRISASGYPTWQTICISDSGDTCYSLVKFST